MKKFTEWQIRNILILYSCMGIVTMATYKEWLFYLGFILLLFGIYYQSRDIIHLLRLGGKKKNEI